MNSLLQQVRKGDRLGDDDALTLAEFTDTRALADVASVLRDQGFRNTVTYSRKVFIPLTHLCRDVCHYCTFARVPRKVMAPYMSIDEVLEVARHGAKMGCKEALFTLAKNLNCATRLPVKRLPKWATSPPQIICSLPPRPCSKKPACCRT